MRRGTHTHALDGHQLLRLCLQYAVQGAERIQQIMRQRIDIPVRNAVEQQQLQYLVICEAVQTLPAEPFPHPLPMALVYRHAAAPSFSLCFLLIVPNPCGKGKSEVRKNQDSSM